jgi:hypothetical protein
MIPTRSFLSAMRAKWTEYGNVGSPALDQVWIQIAETMNKQTASPSLPRPVIPAELGAGKTTAAKMYCSMLPTDETHPGVLIVVRTIDQANEYANDINAWSGSGKPALAYHSEVKPRPKPELVLHYPVLVVCHKGYALALDTLLVEEPERYDRLMKFRNGRRRLAIVDEALDQVYVARITRSALNEIYDLVHPAILKKHLRAVDVINSASRALLLAPESGNRVIRAEELLTVSGLTVEEADAAIVALWQEVRDSKTRTRKDDRWLVQEVLTAFRRHLATYRWTESESEDRAVVGTRLLLPPDAGQVILDATGTLNNVYAGRPDAYEVKSLPRVRDYRTVTLHAVKTRGTGKTAMEKNGAAISKQALDSVLAHYGERATARRVLVVTDKRSAKAVREIWEKTPFASFDVAHWNAIDGRNDWRDFDTLVILGLPWAKISLDLSTYMAVRGIELDDDGLNAPPDGVQAIRETRITAQLAQAMGRIRLRRMVSADGTCEPCDIFVRLSHRGFMADSDNLISGVQRTLVGMQVVPWASEGTETPPVGRPAATSTEIVSQLLALARQMKPGEERPLSRKDFKASRETIRTVLTAARTPGHPIHATVTEAGLRVLEGGLKRGQGGGAGRAPTMLVKARQ